VKETFLTQFENKAMKAHKKGAECFKSQDHIGFLAGYFEEGYYRMLAYAVSGQDLEARKDESGNTVTVVDMLRFFLKVERHGQSRVTQALKKMGKLDKIPEIEAATGRFVDELSDDFMALAKKTTETYRTYWNMGSWEHIEKGLTRSVDSPVDPLDKLFMEDEAAMAILNRRKAPSNLNRLIKEVQGILQ